VKETLTYAKYNQAGNKAIYGILNSMSNEQREMDRGSYYGSLSAAYSVPSPAYTIFFSAAIRIASARFSAPSFM